MSLLLNLLSCYILAGQIVLLHILNGCCSCHRSRFFQIHVPLLGRKNVSRSCVGCAVVIWLRTCISHSTATPADSIENIFDLVSSALFLTLHSPPPPLSRPSTPQLWFVECHKTSTWLNISVGKVLRTSTYLLGTSWLGTIGTIGWTWWWTHSFCNSVVDFTLPVREKKIKKSQRAHKKVTEVHVIY